MTRTVVIAGVLPLDDDATFAELNEMDRRFTKLSVHHPDLARATFSMLGEVARHAPEVWVHLTARTAAPDEGAALDALPHRGVAEAAAAALAHGEGMVEEYRAWVRPWGFVPEDVAGEVVIWQGGADALVPSAWGATLAGRIPGARLEARAGAGHFLAYAHTAEVLTYFSA